MQTDVQTLALRDHLDKGEMFALARTQLSNTRPALHHTHDFHELIWVETGEMRHHINGAQQTLTPGDMVFIRPTDTHALQGRAEATTAVSIMLHQRPVRSLANRHVQVEGHFFWSEALLPRIHSLTPDQQSTLLGATSRLATSPRTLLSIEALLIPLIADLLPAAARLPAEAPDWLHHACTAAQSPKVFRDGAAGFVAATGRAHAHVSRTARSYLGQSPSEYINDIRMAHAARCLSTSEMTLPEIAADCGIPNLSHFHRLFRSHSDMTPRAYRQHHQKEFVQPVKNG